MSRRACAFAALLALATPVAAQPLPAPVDAQGRLAPGWRVVALPAQKPPLTRYAGAVVDGQPLLRIEAEASYGPLVLDLAGRAAPQHLAWRWRVDRPLPTADVRHKASDDTAARVCLGFDLPLEKLPFVERQLLRLARSRSGEALPGATLCWIWGAQEEAGTVIANPYSRRLRYIVLRGAADGTGRWLEERRDVAADFRRAFGDESTELPPLLALMVGADADNTGGHAAAQLGALRFEP